MVHGVADIRGYDATVRILALGVTLWFSTLSCTGFDPTGANPPGPDVADAAPNGADAAIEGPDARVPDAGDDGLFPYVPSNFDPDDLDPGPPVTLGCSARFESTTLSFSEWCGQPEPTPVTVAQPGGPEAVLLAMESLSITGMGSLTLTGARPVILVSMEDALLLGPIFASSSEFTPGAGSSNQAVCGDGTGADGANFLLGAPGGGGGGGGGFGDIGGTGGVSSAGSSPGEGGATGGDAALIPLRAGCAGGRGGRAITPGPFGGVGGGAVQVSAAQTLSVGSFITASGAGGGGGNVGNGGGGGGSGGGVLLEGDFVSVTMLGAVTANGGGGGEGGTEKGCNCADGADGDSNSGVPAAGGSGTGMGSGDGGNGGADGASAGDGLDGNDMLGGGGGGGGSVGRIRINAGRACTVGGAVFSPAPTSNGAQGCP